MVINSQNVHDNLIKIYQDNGYPVHLWVCLFFKYIHNLQAVRLSAVPVPIFTSTFISLNKN